MKFIKKYQNLHLPHIQSLISLDNKYTSGIYMLLNRNKNMKYIGSAAIGRIYPRFRSHFFKTNGSKLIKLALLEDSLEN
jgi:hypothetical protein